MEASTAEPVKYEAAEPMHFMDIFMPYLEGEACVNNLLVHASVEVRAGVLHDHAILHADLRAAVLVATDFLFAHVVFGIGTTLWSIVGTFAHVVHGVHEVVVEFGRRLLLVAI